MANAAKRGRKPKPGERYPSGQIRPEVCVTSAQYQRMRMITRDPALGTHLGRMGFLGQLDPVEVATGHRIAAIYGSFDKAMGRIRFARSPGYEIGRGKTPDVEETEQQTERVANAIRRMSHLESEIEALANSFFPGLRHELEVLCLLDELPTAGVMPLVRRALSELAGPLGVRAQMARRKPDSQAERSRM